MNDKLHCFAILLPAYNEEKVIGFAIESLKNLNYPKDLFKIFVVADHCSDRTVEIAHSMSVDVLAHDGPQCPTGKGYALKWAVDKIVQMKRFDAICYFDADSLAHPDFLKAVNDHVNAGEQVIQGHQLAKNRDGWISRILAAGHIISNRFFQKPKHDIGLSATLHGKGMCFTIDVAKEFPWDETCLTEDLEMQMRLVRNGVRIAWAEEAIVFDEEPTKIKQYIKRTVRWTRGSLDTARRHLSGLFIRAVKMKDLKALEAALYCSNVYRLALITFTGALIYYTRDSFNLFIYLYHLLPGVQLIIKLLAIVPLILYPAVVLLIEKVELDILLGYFMQPILGFLRFPVFIAGVFRDQINWGRTEHTSEVAISELVE
jgi:cellulose synthase/poly-beta-1,6-N-acetylglucosamine synthase-like glycosyltransferase